MTNARIGRAYASRMQLRMLGPDMPQVSAIGYGAMPLSILGRPDEAQAVRVLHAVLDAGVTLIDTADVYSLDGTDTGHNERLIAKALASWSGSPDEVIVATKGGSTHPEERVWRPDCSPEHIKRACEASLVALGVECIDLYFLHTRDQNVPYADSLGAVSDLRAAGKVRWLGVSNVTKEMLAEARSILPVQVVQNMLNPFFRDALQSRFLRPSLVRRCAKLGIGFMAHSPTGGWLNTKLAEHSVVAPIAEAHGCSPHAVVLAWVLAQGPNVFAIPGARRVESALDSIAAADLRLSGDELAAIDAAEFPRE